MKRHGLLLNVTEPPPHMEEEFNAWYDEEHFPERLAIPGFRSARRWVADAPSGSGKYLATYELDSVAVLQSREYLSRFENPTPWSRRCLGKAVVFRRWALEQVSPGAADPHPAAKGVLFACGGASLDRLVVAGALQGRHFVASSGEPAHVALFDLAWPALHDPLPLEAGEEARLYRAYPGPRA
ncbi:MAG: hypothetical protein JO035_13895 [Betaproteobacteria bacterium]|nr:hypothetical protein [Betaproteobacteria bacterium]